MRLLGLARYSILIFSFYGAAAQTTVPIRNGGTNATYFINGKIVTYDGTRLISTAKDTSSWKLATDSTGGTGYATGYQLSLKAPLASPTFSGSVGIGTGSSYPLQIGGTPTSSYSMYMSSVNSGIATSALGGMYLAPRFTPGGASLSGYYGSISYPVMDGTSFTIANAAAYNGGVLTDAGFSGTVTHAKAFEAVNGTVGGGTVTNYSGFYANNITVGTNKFGFYSNLAYAANKWNFYAAGTATNYFAAAVTIGSTTTTSMFNVGTSAGFQINDDGRPASVNSQLVPISEHYVYPPMVDTVRRFNYGTSISATAFNNATTNGLYRISLYLHTTVTGSGGTVTATVRWNGGAAKSAATSSVSLTSLGDQAQLLTLARVTSSPTAPTFETAVSGASGSPEYELLITIEKLF